MSFPRRVHGTENEAFNSYTVEGPPVGSLMVVEDGRTFRFSECGASTALVVANLNQGEVPSADFADELAAAAAAGDTVLTDVGATTGSMAVNALKEGFVYTSGTKELPLVRVRDNTKITLSATTGTITLYNPIPTAIVAGSTISYFKNPWRDVIAKPASANTAMLTGVCKIALAVNAFGWLQTSGPCSVIYDASTTAIAGVGDPVGPDQAVVGAVSGLADSAVDTDNIIGTCLGPVAGDTEQTSIFLRLE